MSLGRHLRHVTLATGEVRERPREEIPEGVIAAVRQLVERVVAGKTVDVPMSEPPCTMTGAARAGTLIATVWGPSLLDDRVPLITIGVASQDRGGLALWRALDQPEATCPAAPWCAVKFEAGLGAYRAAWDWLADFDRAVAWAWLDLPSRNDPAALQVPTCPNSSRREIARTLHGRLRGAARGR